MNGTDGHHLKFVETCAKGDPSWVDKSRPNAIGGDLLLAAERCAVLLMQTYLIIGGVWFS